MNFQLILLVLVIPPAHLEAGTMPALLPSGFPAHSMCSKNICWINKQIKWWRGPEPLGSECPLVRVEAQQATKHPADSPFASCFHILLGPACLFIFAYGLNTFLLSEQQYLYLQPVAQGVCRNGKFPFSVLGFVFTLLWLLTPNPVTLLVCRGLCC